MDDREDKLAGYCLVTSTYTIEQYCKRRFLRKRHFERIEFTGELFLFLREYPVTEILAVYALESGEIVEPEFYHTIPDCGLDCDYPFILSLSPAAMYYPDSTAFKVVYWAGNPLAKVPPDLGTACLELAAWNMARYKGKRIGMTGSVRKEGENYTETWCGLKSICLFHLRGRRFGVMTILLCFTISFYRRITLSGYY